MSIGAGVGFLAVGTYAVRATLSYHGRFGGAVAFGLADAACLVPGGLFLGAGLYYEHPAKEFPPFP